MVESKVTRQNREISAKAAADGDKTLARAWSRVPASTGAPGLPSHSQLLASVAQFTYHRDIDTLDHSLVLTLAELTSAHSIFLGKRGGGSRFTLDSIVQCRLNADGKYAVTVAKAPGPEHPATARLLKSMEEMERYAQIDVNGIYLLTVPILCEGRAIAALHLASSLLPSSSRPLLEGFACIYANYTALLDESERDKLTGLYNRRTFDRHLQRMLQPSKTLPTTKPAIERRNRPASASVQVWLAILDIDHFKRINDRYGHIYGDEVILLLAQQMNASFRHDDKLFRFGGEEFVILLRVNDEPTMQMVLERFRQCVAEHVFPQVEHVTVSIGYARISEHDYPRTVLDRADKALYFAKENGRNRICGYENLVAGGLLEQTTTAGTIDLF